MIKKSKKISSITLTLMLCASVSIGSASATEVTFTRNITLGTHGDDVSALQQILIDSGFLKISTPTDYFGPLTKNALSAWQASVGISPASGFLGPISRNRISTTASPTNKSTVAPGCTSTSGFSTTTGASCMTSVTPSTQVVPVIATASTPPAPTTSSASIPIANKQDGSPVRLKIPKIDVDTSFQYNGLTSDGAMEIPNNVVDVGWFTGSVKPGERGTSVITGHVAQIRGGVLTKPGVFIALKDLRVGDTLSVLNDKGESTTFVVRETRNYDPLADATDVFAENDNGAHMNIITCEGTWHPDQLSYSQRLVVFTDAVK